LIRPPDPFAGQSTNAPLSCRVCALIAAHRLFFTNHATTWALSGLTELSGPPRFNGRRYGVRPPPHASAIVALLGSGAHDPDVWSGRALQEICAAGEVRAPRRCADGKRGRRPAEQATRQRAVPPVDIGALDLAAVLPIWLILGIRIWTWRWPRVPADPIDVGYDLVDLVLMPASGAAVGAPQARPPSLPPVRFQYAS
jgi:hypothetical protein